MLHSIHRMQLLSDTLRNFWFFFSAFLVIDHCSKCSPIYIFMPLLYTKLKMNRPIIDEILKRRRKDNRIWLHCLCCHDSRRMLQMMNCCCGWLVGTNTPNKTQITHNPFFPPYNIRRYYHSTIDECNSDREKEKALIEKL